MRELTTIADYFIVATGAVDVHLKAVVDYVLEELKKEKVFPLNVEGYENLRWVLVDFVDVVAHFFLPQYRDFYGIERLWMEAEKKEYE